jgi:hypothetical protein
MEKVSFRGITGLESDLLKNISEYHGNNKTISNKKFSQNAAYFLKKLIFFVDMRNIHGIKIPYMVNRLKAHEAMYAQIKTDNMITYMHIPGHDGIIL